MVAMARMSLSNVYQWVIQCLIRTLTIRNKNTLLAQCGLVTVYGDIDLSKHNIGSIINKTEETDKIQCDYEIFNTIPQLAGIPLTQFVSFRYSSIFQNTITSVTYLTLSPYFIGVRGVLLNHKFDSNDMADVFAKPKSSFTEKLTTRALVTPLQATNPVGRNIWRRCS